MVINMEEHKRRPRYKGTHPRKFEEKYKELNPEKYADTVAKVISKGSTPAGMHISIMVRKSLISCRYSLGRRDWMPPWDMADIPERCWNSCRDRDTYMGWM